MNTVIKLHGDDPLGPLGVAIRETAVRTNSGRMSAEVTLTTQSEDRDGDVVVTKGISLEDHQRNPICVLNHKMEAVVGYFEDKLGTYTVKRNGDKALKGEVFFNQSTQLGQETFAAVHAKILRATSIGFLPIAGKIEKRHQRGAIYHESKLVEGTITTIGSNSEAIIEAVHKTFKAKPPCPELAAILPKWEPKEQVTGGFLPAEFGQPAMPAVPEFLTKGNTYKMAEPKEAVAKNRSATYYECPHCGEEMGHENIFREDDGTTRHGPCRGAVILKSPEQLEPAKVTVGEQGPTMPDADITASQTAGAVAMNKSRFYQPSPRFLPGVRRKAMDYDNDMDEDFTPGGDEDMDMEEEGTGMKAGAEAHHGVNDIIMEAMQFIDDAKGSVDNATVLKTLDKVSGALEKALSALHAGHASYLNEHPDQPPLPGAPEAESDGEVSDELDDDTENDDEWEEPEEKGRKARKKALDAYWESLKRYAVIGDGPVVKSARDFLDGIAGNRMVVKEIRTAAKSQAKELAALLAKDESTAAQPAPTIKVEGTDDEWASAIATLNLET